MTTPAHKIGLDSIRFGLWAALQTQGLDARWLSEATGIQQSQLINYFRGRGNLGAAALDRCVAALGLAVALVPAQPQDDGLDLDLAFDDEGEG